jgi:hypothetical protein
VAVELDQPDSQPVLGAAPIMMNRARHSMGMLPAVS